MSLLKRMMLFVLGGKPPQCPLRELFQREKGAEFGIILEEIGLPCGGKSTYTWWKSNDAAFFRMAKQAVDQVNAKVEESEIIQDTLLRFDKLAKLMEECEGLERYIDYIRDGGIYNVYWGTMANPQRLRFSNPVLGSRHHQLVTRLKEHAWWGRKQIHIEM